LREECVVTKNLIANYTLDIKLAKAHLLNSGSAPEFPDSEWKSVLSGLCVNLDVVFSGRYSTEHDTKVSHKIGDIPSQPERPPHPKLSDRQGTGSSSGPRRPPQQLSLSPTGSESVKNTGSTSLDSSQPSQRNTTTSSSTMTGQSASVSPCDETYSSLTSPTSVTCEYSSSMCEAPILGNKRKRPVDDVPQDVQMTCACGGTKGRAPQQLSGASTNTSALTVAVPDTSMVTAQPNTK
jgi:hypothetical protein